MLAIFCKSFPPASEREARMDDPTRRCENDTDNGTRLLGAPGPKREPHLFGPLIDTQLIAPRGNSTSATDDDHPC